MNGKDRAHRSTLAEAGCKRSRHARRSWQTAARPARKDCRFSLFNARSDAPRSGGNEWSVDRCGREKRWRATAFQDAGAFAERWDGAQRRGMLLPSGALRGKMPVMGSEKGKAAIGADRGLMPHFGVFIFTYTSTTCLTLLSVYDLMKASEGKVRASKLGKYR